MFGDSKDFFLKRESFSDSQIIRNGFYSCSEYSRETTASFETDFRHHSGFLGRGLRGEASNPVQEKIRIIRKAVKKASLGKTLARKKNQKQSRG